ncbi:MAG: GNAT family N-acetyltransferase [Eubacteriales bacterium]|nr:GNAT family N-acetyltransferase [Eubacteriales bacterium]
MPITFETERCTVRPFEQGDIDAFMAYRNNLDWMRYQGFKGLTRQAYEEALLGVPNLDCGVQLAVVSRQTGGLIGDLYLRLEKKTGWIGYTIAPQFARQGLANEVVTELLLQLQQAGLTLVKAGVEELNLASIQLLKKLGFEQFGVEDSELIFQLDLSKIVPVNRDKQPIEIL